jgi:hypothetical protein
MLGMGRHKLWLVLTWELMGEMSEPSEGLDSAGGYGAAPRGGSKTRTAGVLDEVPATATGRAKGRPRARKALSRSIRVGKVHRDPRTECVRGMVKKFDYASTRGM